jgi:hypothetical protein
VFVFLDIAYNFCYGSFVSGGYFATEDKEGHRGKKRKDLKTKRVKQKRKSPSAKLFYA